MWVILCRIPEKVGKETDAFIEEKKKRIQENEWQNNTKDSAETAKY